MNSETKIILGVSVFILLLAAVGALFALGVIDLPSGAQNEVTIGDEKEDRRLDSFDAIAVAKERAVQWRPDAVLAYSGTLAGQTTATGRSDSWELIFTSPTLKDRGFRVVISDRNVTTAEEMPYAKKGAAVPDNLIPSEQAAEYVRTLKGYENEQIISVELLYEAQAKMWFWGVKTSKGVVAIKAQP